MKRTSNILQLVFVSLIICLLSEKVNAKCGKPPTINDADAKNATSSTDEYETGTVIIYTCDYGLAKRSGSGISKCEASGDWSLPDIICDAITCGSPEAPLNGKVVGTEFKFGLTVEFVCHPGYVLWSSDETKKLIKSPLITCMVDGWRGDIPKCLPVDCPQVNDIPNGQKTISSINYLGKITYTCNAGFHLKSGDLERICQPDGTWSGTEPECEDISCEDPEVVGFISKHPNVLKCEVKTALDPGSVADCTCKDKSQKETIMCLENGEWEIPCKSEDTTLPPTTPSTSSSKASQTTLFVSTQTTLFVTSGRNGPDEPKSTGTSMGHHLMVNKGSLVFVVSWAMLSFLNPIPYLENNKWIYHIFLFVLFYILDVI